MPTGDSRLQRPYDRNLAFDHTAAARAQDRRQARRKAKRARKRRTKAKGGR
jgi:hypothetical protein